MKSFFKIALLFFTLISCENTETNYVALQAELGGRLYESNGAIAIENEDGSFFIHGLTTVETLILKISGPEEGTYNLGGNSVNYGAFEDLDGIIFYTNPNGFGQVIVSNWNTDKKTLSGTFSFNAVSSGRDTLVVKRGVFYQVPYGTEPEVVEEPDYAGFFLSEINGIPFSPMEVTGVQSENSIVIMGGTESKNIEISVPSDVQTGNVPLPAAGFTASITNQNGTEQAISGNIIIISHEPAIKKIKGTFSFQTESNTVTLGQFNVTYQ